MTDAVRFISVRENGEWGSFFVRSGVSEREGRDPQYWCELTCNTSFGCVGYFWSHMGRPAPEFLAKIDKHYALDKLWGMKSEVFDFGKALEEARDLVLKERRAGDLTRYEARDRWDELEDENWDGEADFISFVHRCDWLYQHLSEGGGPLGQVPNPQAEGFWSTLWPDFIRQMAKEHSSPSGDESVAMRVVALADEMDHVAAADIANEPGSPKTMDGRDSQRLDWLIRMLPGSTTRNLIGVLSDSSDVENFRVALDRAIAAQERRLE